MRVIKIDELNCWAVSEQGENDELPTVITFKTRNEAREYQRGNKPSLLSRLRLHFERSE